MPPEVSPLGNRLRVLYLSHTGLLDPLGQSQVLQYLVGLAAKGHELVLLTFEKPDEWSDKTHREATRRITTNAGIRWIPLGYHRRPRGLATVYDVVAGLFVAIWASIRYRTQIVHARGYVMAGIAAPLSALLGARFVFDPRSFWPDERVEIGIWRGGSLPHRIAKRLERWFLSRADAVVSLTESGVATMRAQIQSDRRSQRFAVITTCTNLEHFHPGQPGSAPKSPFTLGYLGTLGTPYLLDEVFHALTVARSRRGDSRLLILNRRDHAYVKERARRCRVPFDAVELKSVSYQQVARELLRMTAGVIFITPSPCRQSCAPTKLGELLASGVPCIANAGVGDLERILDGEGVGVIVPDFSAAAMGAGIDELMRLCDEPDLAQRCAAVARRYFSLEAGVSAYDTLYREIRVRP